jgi:hypothetical protein
MPRKASKELPSTQEMEIPLFETFQEHSLTATLKSVGHKVRNRKQSENKLRRVGHPCLLRKPAGRRQAEQANQHTVRPGAR